MDSNDEYNKKVTYNNNIILSITLLAIFGTSFVIFNAFAIYGFSTYPSSDTQYIDFLTHVCIISTAFAFIEWGVCLLFLLLILIIVFDILITKLVVMIVASNGISSPDKEIQQFPIDDTGVTVPQQQCFYKLETIEDSNKLR